MTSKPWETARERSESHWQRLVRDEQEARSRYINVCTAAASEASLYQAWLIWCHLCDSRLEVERLIDEQDQ